MSVRIAILAPLLLLLAGCASLPAPQLDETEPASFARNCSEWDEWTTPTEPFRIHGDTYYVGTCGIAVLAVKGDGRHVLFDTGPRESVDAVVTALRGVGIGVGDVALILTSHEHHDHVGGVQDFIARSGAALVTSAAAARTYETGQPDEADPQFGQLPAIAPVSVARMVGDGEQVVLGDLAFTAIASPGHTPGALSWQWESCEDGQCLTIVYADSLSPVGAEGYRFSDHPEYVRAYRESLERLAALDCDILLTPHPSASNMLQRLAGAAPLVDPDGCRNYAARQAARLEARLAAEGAGAE